MLKDQEFPHPIIIGIGHELFHDPSEPTSIDFGRVGAFKREVQAISPFKFVYIDLKKSKEVDTEEFYNLLSSYGIAFMGGLFYDPSTPDGHVSLNSMIRALDLAYAPELLSRPSIIHRLGISDLPPAGFMECLIKLAGLPNPFTQQLFRQIESAWRFKHYFTPNEEVESETRTGS